MSNWRLPMLIGALLLITWAILLIRYPLRAIPVSLGALLGLGLVAGWVIWQEQREAHLLAQLELQMAYTTDACPVARPLHIVLHNRSNQPLRSLQWQVAAYSPGSSLNLASPSYDELQYRGAADLQPGASWELCAPLPSVRSGYRGSDLLFQAERLRGSFAD